ncbi:hypothetical protein ACF5W4_02965 [Bacillota bacterium Lsc_1132]
MIKHVLYIGIFISILVLPTSAFASTGSYSTHQNFFPSIFSEGFSFLFGNTKTRLPEIQTAII